VPGFQDWFFYLIPIFEIILYRLPGLAERFRFQGESVAVFGGQATEFKPDLADV
jgi:hypothetical protein